MTRVPLDLFIEVTGPDGTRYQWDANQPVSSRPLGLRFSTKIGDGFSDCGLQLARRIDQDYPDLQLGNAVVITAADGTIVYEGFISAMPRELGDRHSIGVTVTGWMAHAKDRKFAMPFVDRDIGRWQQMPIEARAGFLAAGFTLGDFSYTAAQGGMTAALPNQALGSLTLHQSWYAAPPGTTIGGIGYRGKTTTLPAGWVQRFATTDNRDTTGAVNVTPTLDDTLRALAVATPARYVYHETYSSGSAATPASGSSVQFSKLAVYGNHGVGLYTGDATEPAGVYGSDVIKWIAANYCPLLNTTGVEASSYVIQHLAYNERTFPFDAFLDINKYHLRHLGVWENRTLTWRPYDLSDYDWEIRTDDPGTTWQAQGPSTENLHNGIAVTYTDLLTGSVNTLTPDDTDDLRDLSIENPWNLQGRDRWDDLTISTPQLEADAAQIGAAVLADRNRPRAPGQITVKGYIRDRAGNSQPASKVRSGQTIAITNFPNDRPRLIVETGYNDDKSLTIHVEQPAALVEAYFDRLNNAAEAAGLG